MSPVLIRVVAPHFVAGLEVERGYVTRTAPILKWARGMQAKSLVAYCAFKGWAWERVQ